MSGKNYYQLKTSMNEQDLKIRKYWLITTIFEAVWPFIFFLTAYFWGLAMGTQEVSEIVSIIFAILFGSLSTALFTYILIYCAYTKFGTAYLTFCLIISQIVIVKYAASLLNIIEAPPSSTVAMFELFLSVVWCYLSLKMRMINKKIQRERLLSSDSFRKSAALLKDASSLDELNQKFHGIVSDSCPGKLVNVLQEVYLERKGLFEKESPSVN